MRNRRISGPARQKWGEPKDLRRDWRWESRDSTENQTDGNENKLKSIGEGLASGTAEILLAMFEHQGTAHKLHDLARDSSGHKLATSFIDMSVLEEHGLSQHELVTVHAVAGSMNERIFEQLKRGGPAGGDAHCPSKPEIGEEGGSGFIADAVSSDKGASDKYLVDVQKPTNYDPR